MSEALDYAQKTAEGFKRKADHNKSESLFCFISILVSSLSAPLFITLGEGEFLSKILPSILSVIAGGLTSWLQLRKPQKLWAMYRGSQRHIENSITKFQFKIGDFINETQAEALLAENVAKIALAAHHEWVTVIPTPESLSLKEGSNGE